MKASLRFLPWCLASLLAVPVTIAVDADSAPPDNDQLPIVDKLIDWGYELSDDRRVIDTIILHSTYNASGDPYSIHGILAQFRTYGVASHYLIGRDGTVYRLVDDAHVAYHAGRGTMPDGRTAINDFSIGIEINNTRLDGPNDSQYDALSKLILILRSKYEITSILRHSDVAPGRKTDPWSFSDEEWCCRP